MTYKFKLNSDYYQNISKYKNKIIKKNSITKCISLNLFYIASLLFFFKLFMIVSKDLRPKGNDGFIINYIILIIVIIIMTIISSITLYRYLKNQSLNFLKWISLLDKFEDDNNRILKIEKNNIILESYGYSLEIPKNNIKKVIERDNLLLIFNNINDEVIIIPKGIISINDIENFK